MRLVIDEVLEVREYLEGKNLRPDNMYRALYMLVKWYGEQGMDNLSIREAVFAWGKARNVFIKYNVNDIIKAASADKKRLTRGVSIKISGSDIAQISRRFDRPKTRLAALAVLCFAKAHADENGIFTFSSVAFGSWIGMHRTTLQRKYIQELCDFGYIRIVERPRNSYAWNRADTYTKCCTYQMLVPLQNGGEFMLDGNDVLSLYRQCCA